ncbi:MAG: hypothetical protein ABR543_13590 [Gemmatimonadaceae bacterium]
MTLIQIVARERARLSVAMAIMTAALALAIGGAIAAFATILLGDARWITRPSGPMAAWVLGACLIGAATYLARREARRTGSGKAVAAAIESERSLRAGSIRGAMEVAESGALGGRAAHDVAVLLGRSAGVLAPALHRVAWKRAVLTAVVAVAALVLLGAARQKSPDGWRAFVHPVSAWTGDLLPKLQIVGTPPYVMRGERLRVRVSAPERRNITLHRRSTGQAWDSQMLSVSSGIAEVSIGPVDADVILVASDGRATSDTVTVRVADRPFLGAVAVRATYPAYLGRAAEAIPVGEPVRLPQGTSLYVQGKASANLREVLLATTRDSIRLRSEGHDFTGRFAAASGRWTWIARAESTSTGIGGGAIADVPAPLDIEIVPDSAPRIDILSPSRDTVILAASELRLMATAMDDHGLSAVAMRSWRETPAGSQPEINQSIASGAGPQWSDEIMLDLSARGLEPGDALHVILSAADDSPWRHTSESRELVLRVPSLTEQRELARSLADSTAARAEAAAKSQRQLAQRTGEAARGRGRRNARDQRAEDTRGRAETAEQKDRAMSFEAAERSRALAKEQQRLQDQIRALQKDARALERQLEAAGALDSSLARQLTEARALLDEAITPELEAKLKDVLESTQKLSEADARRALENLVEQQKRLREQLERSAEMLKRAALEGAMETLKDEAKEIAQQERTVADSLAAGDSSAAKEAQDLSERSRDLSADAQDLARRLDKARAESGPERLESASKKAAQSSDAMRKAAQATQQPRKGGHRSEANQSGENEEREAADAAREGAAQMEDAAQQLSDAREKQIEEWKQELTGELDRSIQETLQLAREQQNLAQRARAGTTQGLRADQSAVQQGVEKVGERLQKTAGTSAHVSAQSQAAVGEAQRNVREATEQVANSQRGGAEAANTMQDAAQALNRAAAALVKDRERAAGGESASGFSEMLDRMREMAKAQGNLNAQAAGLMPVPGSKPGGQLSAEARSLGAKQRGLAEQMDQVGGGENAARAEQLAKEMRQIAEELESGRLDPGVLERQQRVFRRMLDAGLSMEKEEREETGERESRSASSSDVLTPGSSAAARAGNRFREPSWNELRGLSAEERRAVLEYFKRINAEKP